jgi:hypothetical protein
VASVRAATDRLGDRRVHEPPEVRLTVIMRPATFLRSVSEIGIMRLRTPLDNDHVYVASGDIPDELGQVRPLTGTNLRPPDPAPHQPGQRRYPAADQPFHRKPSHRKSSHYCLHAGRLPAGECRAPPR